MADSSNGAPPASQSSRVFTIAQTYCLPILVLSIGLFAASSIYRTFCENHEQLWTSLTHDRNAHYWLSLHFAISLRHGDVLHLIDDLHKARVWPPLHPILAGAVMAVGGLDDCVAVLPNLLGWVMSAVFAFLLARRSVRRGGDWAGLVAATFVLVSPAHRAYATDIMLESLGACLTLAVLYAFLVAVQEPSRWHGRWFGFAMTILFFQKYNYWLLVLMAVSLWVMFTYWRIVRDKLWEFHQTFSLREWLIAQRKHPLNYICIALCAASVLTIAGCLKNVQIFGFRFSAQSPVNVVSAAFFALVLRMLPWYLRHGRNLVQSLPDVPRQFIYWHIWPTVLWLLWPQRLWNFLFFLSPASEGEQPTHDMIEGWSRYWNYLMEDYHLFAWSLFLVAGLIVLAVLKWKKMREGGVVLIAFLALSILLTVHHPNRKSRFTHSWVAIGWVLAGVGMTQLIYSRRRIGLRNARPWLAGTATAALMVFHHTGTLQSGHSPEGGPKPDKPSSLQILAEYRQHLAGAKRVAVLSNYSSKFYMLWPVLESNGYRVATECDLRRIEPMTVDSAEIAGWLETNRFDKIVFIQFEKGSPFDEGNATPGMDRIPALLAEQPSLKCIHSGELPRFRCIVKVFSPN